jgi:VIT1/CCC1 family predicted Fe2+/Mn2+ transporter
MTPTAARDPIGREEDRRELRREAPRTPAEFRRAHEPPFGGAWVRHYLRDFIYGANDGIITTFAVVSGVAGAALPARTALILGVANLLADGFSMGASNVLAIRSDEAGRAAAGEEPVEPFPLRHGLATMLAFLVAGSVPLIPYVLAPARLRFAVAVAATLVTLFGVGALRSTVTRHRWWSAGADMLGVGALAAGVSYLVGLLLARLT